VRTRPAAHRAARPPRSPTSWCRSHSHADRRLGDPAAAYCGAYAIKPSFGAINRAGTKFLAESLDSIGIFARSAEDLALAMEVLTGRTSISTNAKPRIGLCRTPRWSLADPAVQSTVERAARTLERAGAAVRDFELRAGRPISSTGTR